MRTFFLTLVLVFAGMTSLRAQTPNSPQDKRIQRFLKDHPAWAYIPEQSFLKGGETVNAGGFFMFKGEVTNLDWKEFVAANGGESNSDLMPQFDLWNSLLGNQEWQNQYYQNSAYNNYPVVNVSYPQAEAYCRWLQDNYNNSSQKPFKSVRIGIPSATDWSLAAAGGVSGALYPWGGNQVVDGNNRPLANFYMIDQGKVLMIENGQGGMQLSLGPNTTEKPYNWLNPTQNHPFPVKSFAPNGFGLYDMAGNVSELVLGVQEFQSSANWGHSMGGSWGHPGYDLQISVHQTHPAAQSASPFRGFRPVMHVEF